MRTLRALVPFTMLAFGCGDNSGDGPQQLVDLNDEPAGTNCAAGGVRIDTGLDTDDNGSLDTSEIENTKYACNGSDGDTPGSPQIVKSFTSDGILMDGMAPVTIASVMLTTTVPGKAIAIGSADTFCVGGSDCPSGNTPSAAGWMWVSTENLASVPTAEFDYFYMQANNTESMTRTQHFALATPGTTTIYLRGERDEVQVGWFSFYRRGLTVVFLPD